MSALLFPDSVPFQAFFGARERGDVVLSAETIEEIAGVLRRPKFDRYVHPEERDRFLAALIRQSVLINPNERFRVCRDPNDDKWLEVAVAGAAEQLISGDNDLLCLKQFRGIPIVTAAQFLTSLAPS